MPDMKTIKFDPRLSSEAGIIFSNKVMENSGTFRVELIDFAKAALAAVITAVIAALYGIIVKAGFDVFTADWHAILNMIVNAGVAGFTGYMGTTFFSDKSGKVFGKV